MALGNEPITLVGKPGEDNGMVADLVNAIFQPGVNAGLHRFTNYAFIGLLVVLIGVSVFLEFNIHLLFMLVLSGSLLIGINWFIEEQREVEKEQALQSQEEKFESAKDR
eukprot:CFRG8493T1